MKTTRRDKRVAAAVRRIRVNVAKYAADDSFHERAVTIWKEIEAVPGLKGLVLVALRADWSSHVNF